MPSGKDYYLQPMRGCVPSTAGAPPKHEQGDDKPFVRHQADPFENLERRRDKPTLTDPTARCPDCACPTVWLESRHQYKCPLCTWRSPMLPPTAPPVVSPGPREASLELPSSPPGRLVGRPGVSEQCSP